MHTARQLLAQALEPLLPAVRVLDYALELGGLEGPAVMIRLDEVLPSPQPQAWRRYRFTLVVVVDTITPGPADDELDATLELVLDALDLTDLPAWTSAQRAVVTDGEDRPRWPAYEVGLTLDTTTAP